MEKLIIDPHNVKRLDELVAPGQETVRCQRCGDVDPVVSQSGDHLRADCPKCGRYIRFLKHRDADLVSIIKKIAPRMNQKDRKVAIQILKEE